MLPRRRRPTLRTAAAIILNAYVTVRVRDGDAAIEDLFLSGKPLREYLHGAR